MSAPIELYRFAIDTSVWTFTSGDVEATYGGETYTPAAIGRDAIEQGKEINRANLTLHVPRTHPVAALYLSTVPDFPASLTIYRQDGAGTAALWKGRIAGASASGSEVTLDCESAFTSLRRSGLRARYQVGCRHALYHRGCGLSIEDWAVQGIPSSISGTLITVTEAASQPDGDYLAGLVREPGGVLRWIVAHSGDQLTLNRAFDGADGELANSGYGNNYGNYYGGYAVKIYPGCDRTKETCNDKFSNILNYGGFAWIPAKSPFDGSSIV